MKSGFGSRLSVKRAKLLVLPLVTVLLKPAVSFGNRYQLITANAQLSTQTSGARIRVVLPAKRHRPVPKEAGETNHIERLNNTLRQWCANLVRKTLSFSKDLELHKTRIRMVIEHCNARTDLWAAV